MKRSILRLGMFLVVFPLSKCTADIHTSFEQTNSIITLLQYGAAMIQDMENISELEKFRMGLLKEKITMDIAFKIQPVGISHQRWLYVVQNIMSCVKNIMINVVEGFNNKLSVDELNVFLPIIAGLQIQLSLSFNKALKTFDHFRMFNNAWTSFIFDFLDTVLQSKKSFFVAGIQRGKKVITVDRIITMISQRLPYDQRNSYYQVGVNIIRRLQQNKLEMEAKKIQKKHFHKYFPLEVEGFDLTV